MSRPGRPRAEGLPGTRALRLIDRSELRTRCVPRELRRSNLSPLLQTEPRIGRGPVPSPPLGRRRPAPCRHRGRRRIEPPRTIPTPPVPGARKSRRRPSGALLIAHPFDPVSGSPPAFAATRADWTVAGPWNRGGSSVPPSGSTRVSGRGRERRHRRSPGDVSPDPAHSAAHSSRAWTPGVLRARSSTDSDPSPRSANVARIRPVRRP